MRFYTADYIVYYIYIFIYYNIKFLWFPMTRIGSFDYQPIIIFAPFFILSALAFIATQIDIHKYSYACPYAK